MNVSNVCACDDPRSALKGPAKPACRASSKDPRLSRERSDTESQLIGGVG